MANDDCNDISSSRGQKRPRHCAGTEAEHLVGHCHCQLMLCSSDIEVDLPLSKRICLLNIEPDCEVKGARSVVAAPFEAKDYSSELDFRTNYPYDESSPYYANNHLLYHLYLERSRRQAKK